MYIEGVKTKGQFYNALSHLEYKRVSDKRKEISHLWLQRWISQESCSGLWSRFAQMRGNQIRLAEEVLLSIYIALCILQSTRKPILTVSAFYSLFPPRWSG